MGDLNANGRQIMDGANGANRGEGGQDSGIGVNAENDIDKGCREVYLCIVKPESAMWRGWVKSSLT